MVPPLVKEALDKYVNEKVLCDDFVRAVLENDLKKSFQYADDESLRNMFDIVKYLYWEVPSLCWGSPERVNAWLEGA